MSVFRRCSRAGCGARLAANAVRCGKCGSDGFSWAFIVDVGKDATGRRQQRRAGGFATRREAERERRELLAALDQGRYVAPTRLTLATYLRDEWLPATAPPRVAYKTWKERRDSFDAYVIPRVGRVELSKLNAGHLNRLYTELLADGRTKGPGGLSPTTVRDIHRRLRKALADAVRWGLIVRNPTDLADPPPSKAVASARRRSMTTWTADELATFLEATAGRPLYTVWLVAAMTGLRRSELCGLRWADVDFTANHLTVRQTVVEGEDGYELTDGQKSQASARTIHLDSRTAAALRSHRKDQLEVRLAVGPKWNDGELVFPADDGGTRLPASLAQAFRRDARRVGVPRIRLHDVRHTHATLLLRAGVNPKVVSERLGHSSVAFTLDTYAHVMPGMQPEAAELLAGLVFRERDHSVTMTETGRRPEGSE